MESQTRDSRITSDFRYCIPFNFASDIEKEAEKIGYAPAS